MLVWNGDVYEPAVWNRATGKLATLKMPAGKYVAETSDIRWNGAGTQLVVAVHTTEWKKKAQDTFTRMTVGPVFVQDSKDPFLAWDDLRRMGDLRSVGALDVKTGQYQGARSRGADHERTRSPTTAPSSPTAKIRRRRPTTRPAATTRSCSRARPRRARMRTLMASTRGAQVVWAEDGKRYAYSRDGRVYVGVVADTATRMIAGPPEPPQGAPATDAATPAAAADAAGAVDAAATRHARRSLHGDPLQPARRRAAPLEPRRTVGLRSRRATRKSSRSRRTIRTPPRRASRSPRGARTDRSCISRRRRARSGSAASCATTARRSRARELIKDGRTYGNLRLSKDGSTVFLTVAEGNRLGEIYTADADLGNLQALRRGQSAARGQAHSARRS